MYTLENEHLVVEVAEDSGAIQVYDRAAGVRWAQATDTAMLRLGQEGQAAGGSLHASRLSWPVVRVKSIEQTRGGLRVSAELPDVEGATLPLTWDILLEGHTVRLRLHEIAALRRAQVLELAWPQGLVAGNSDESGYLVLPIRTGQLLPFGPGTRPEVHEDTIYGGLKMALFGAAKGRGAVAAIIRTPYDCRLRTEANVGSRYTASPVWIIEGDRLNYAREIDLVFLADASYVEIAKAYRHEMFAQGRFVSLREKMSRSPWVEPLFGAVTGERRTYSIQPAGQPGRPGMRTFFEQAKALGFDRSCIWYCGGWKDKSELTPEVEYARQLSPGFRLSVYTNFIDYQPTAPGYDERDMLRLRDGTIRRNWFTSHTVCSSRRLARARREMPALLGALGQGNVYVDVEGAIALMECFDAEHPQTREQDAMSRRDLLRYVKDLFGSVTTEHLPHDFLCDIVDVGAYTCIYPYQVLDAREQREGAYQEGNSTARSYRDSAGRDWYVIFSCPFQTVPIPLFQLVWHDSVLSMNSSGKYTESFGWLEDYPCEPMHLPLYGLLPDDLSQRSLMMSHFMRPTYCEELVEHRFLTGPTMEYTDRGLYRTRDVQMSRFSDGTVVVVNFGDEPFFYDSHTPVPMHEFAIIRPGQPPVIA